MLLSVRRETANRLKTGCGYFLLLLSVLSALPPPAYCQCRTLRTQGGTRSPEDCVFPFRFDGALRRGCIHSAEDDRYWCSVEVFPNGDHVTGQGRWGHCDPDRCDFPGSRNTGGGGRRTTTTAVPLLSATCRTAGGNRRNVTFGTPCKFPFKYDGRTFSSCTLSGTPPDDRTPWCSTRTDSRGNHVQGTWAHCASGCPGVQGTTTTTTASTRRPRLPPPASLPSLGSGRCHGQLSDNYFVIGGRDARPNAFPFMALIGYARRGRNGRTSRVRYGCGGSLITPRYVLSAAHCFRDLRGAEPVEVLLGELDRSKERDCLGNVCARPVQKVTIDSVTNHEGFTNRFPYADDIALVRLTRDARLTESVQPVCLPLDAREVEAELDLQDLDRLDQSSGRALILGWGRTRFDSDGEVREVGTASAVLQVANVPFAPHSSCRSNFPGVQASGQFCAGKEGVDSCNGDSGGPLILFGSDGRGVQAGIVSFGRPECGNGDPAVYTRVSNYIDWIRRNVRA